MTKKSLATGLLVAAGTLFLATVASSDAIAATTPQPKIVVIDRSTVLRASKVGQDIVRQINAYTTQAENDLKNQGLALQRDGKAFQQQAAILSNDLKAQKMKALEARRTALQGEVQKKQSLIQGGFIKARAQVEQALGPILQGIMAERGANLMLDKNSVVLGTVDVDITQLAVERLNQKMPSIKVELVAPPPGMVPPPQQPQQ
ncbi:MAG TPA: OmpH family outer membrane protein [Rhizomicrobium sp.]|nr:OmpH family outer membrane protein [Rhizomicrobium sp.]